MQTLQDQLNDALGDLSMSRRREEALKAEVAVSAAKLEDRGAELAKAQVHNEAPLNTSLAAFRQKPGIESSAAAARVHFPCFEFLRRLRTACGSVLF